MTDVAQKRIAILFSLGFSFRYDAVFAHDNGTEISFKEVQEFEEIQFLQVIYFMLNPIQQLKEWEK